MPRSHGTGGYRKSKNLPQAGHSGHVTDNSKGLNPKNIANRNIKISVFENQVSGGLTNFHFTQCR